VTRITHIQCGERKLWGWNIRFNISNGYVKPHGVMLT